MPSSNRPYCLLIAFLFSTAVASADQIIQKPEFTVTLPDGWTEIPRELLDQYSAALASQAPNAPRQHYNYGFQSPGKQNFEYPYMMCQILNTGRIPDAEFASIARVSVNDSMGEFKEALSPVLSELEVGKPVYDASSNIIWLSLDMSVPGTGPVAGITGMHPTEEGLIQLAGYALKTDFASNEAAFKSAIGSLKPAPHLAYQPGAGPATYRERNLSYSLGRIAGFALIGAIVGAAVMYLKRA
ncbi:MAG TPA: hypothetical protein PLJ47_10500 [Candidatus Hydrogenedentes bacterium]|nr:hypothetical protein [Candidatus Hydrogenedentota bacterium]